MRVYIAGPMTGHDDYNFPAFHKAKDRLRELGHDPLCPADTFGGDTSRAYTDYMRMDILMLLVADAVAVLPGWEQSRGANVEVAIARCLELPVIPIDDMEPAG